MPAKRKQKPKQQKAKEEKREPERFVAPVSRHEPIKRVDRQHPDEPQRSSEIAAALSAQPSTSVASATQQLAELGLELVPKDSFAYTFVKRPNFGKLGNKINLISNYFPIDIPRGEVYHYDVEVNNIRQESSGEKREGDKPVKKKYQCLSTKYNRRVVETMTKSVDMFKKIQVAYDGRKNLFTRNPLPIKDAKTFPVATSDDSREDRKINYEVIIKPVNQFEQNSPVVSLEPLHQLFARKRGMFNEEIRMAIMAIETILRHGPAIRLIPVGRSFFHQPNLEELPPLSGGRELWFGHHQSVRISQWKPMLNIDRSATAFYKRGRVIDYMMELLHPGVDERERERELRNIRSLRDYERRNLAKELKRVQIQVTHLSYPRKYRVFDIISTSAAETYFIQEQKGKKLRTSVSEYFRSEYRRLMYPNLPCLDVGNEKKHIYLPMEVCVIIEGQHCNKKLSDRQTSEIIRYTACPPAERFREINNTLKDYVTDYKPYLSQFGIRIDPQPLKLQGRVLNPPHVLYDQQQKIMPFNGSWDMKGKRFFSGINIEKWMLLSFSTSRSCTDKVLDDFARMLCDGGRQLGMNIRPPVQVRRFTPRDGSAGDIICKAKQMVPDLQLAVIVLPSQGSDIYSEIKNVAETSLGLMTQCIKDNNTSGRKCNMQLICNLCQKINAKMGGVNNSLVPAEKPPILNKPVIIIGADSTHPAPGDTVKQSIAAVVGSLDSHPSKYAASIRVQELIKREDEKEIEKSDDKKSKKRDVIYTPQTIIVNLKDMVKDLLQAFHRNTKGRKPEKIIFYRDGISEGEFSKVINDELKQIRQACKEMNVDYKPPITLIIVGKRHHTRFCPADRRDGVGKPGNIPPGTTVDTDVVHPVEFDFFMCSHIGIQGTSRPAHYTVLWDDNNFSSDDLQTLTYYLCHTYVRCTRSISIPCPVMYAHLAAFRAKQYLIAKTKEMCSSGSETSEMPSNVVRESIRQAVKVVENMQNKMYFV